MNLSDTQNEIVKEFSFLEGDLEMSVMYLMDLGQKLPPLADQYKVEENIVKGCQSKVWLTAETRKDAIFFTADSNTAITKGLVSLLIRIFNGHTPDEIISSDLFFMKEIGMDRFIGTQRSNGFSSMIRQMKAYALAYKAKSGMRV